LQTQRGQRTRLVDRPDRSLRRDGLFALLLVVCLLAATLASWTVSRHRENRDASRAHQDEAATLVASLSAGFAQTEAVLATANALVDPTGAVDVQRLDTFAQVLLAPGPAGALAYEPIVRDEQRSQFESTFGLQIIDRTTDGTFAPAPRRQVYFPVAFAHPLDEAQRRVLGFDIAQDPLRGDTARSALEQGRARVTPVVALAPSTRPGFLIFQPLKRVDGQVTAFLSITYLGETLGTSIAAALPAGARFRIVDEGAELYHTAQLPRGNSIRSLPIGGRTWQIDLDVPVATSRTLSTAILASGLGLTALAALAALLSLRHHRALVLSRRQIANERDLAAVLALAVTASEVVATAADTIPSIAPAKAVSIGLLEGRDLHIQHSSSLDPALTQRWTVIPLASSTPFGDAVQTGRSIVFRDAGEIEAQYPNVHLDSLRAARALVCSPLAVGQQVIGAIAFGYSEVQAFDAAQLRWLDQITAMVSGALERARLYDTQEQVALTLQRDLLPDALPSSPYYTLSAAYRPGVALALVGGDWYDAFELGDGRLAITIGDVAGKGVRAAASMGKIRHVLRACAGAYREPALVLGHANRLIYEGSPDIFATACYMTLDASGDCRFALAGHPPPLRVGARGAEFVHAKAGAPLGVDVASLYTEGEFHVGVSEYVVLYTDGLVERRDEDIDRSLARLVEVANSIKDNLDAETLATALGDNAQDDVVVLVARSDRQRALAEAP
jgi:serine phosphatase RsbU (regulator of sigma subunit)/CHASE1-domain containing sensor protein